MLISPLIFICLETRHSSHLAMRRSWPETLPPASRSLALAKNVVIRDLGMMVWLQTEIWYAISHLVIFDYLTNHMESGCLGNLKMGGLPPIDGYNRCYSNIDNDAKQSDFGVHFQTHLFWTESVVKYTTGKGAGKSGDNVSETKQIGQE